MIFFCKKVFLMILLFWVFCCSKIGVQDLQYTCSWSYCWLLQVNYWWARRAANHWSVDVNKRFNSLVEHSLHPLIPTSFLPSRTGTFHSRWIKVDFHVSREEGTHLDYLLRDCENLKLFLFLIGYFYTRKCLSGKEFSKEYSKIQNGCWYINK